MENLKNLLFEHQFPEWMEMAWLAETENDYHQYLAAGGPKCTCILGDKNICNLYKSDQIDSIFSKEPDTISYTDSIAQEKAELARKQKIQLTNYDNGFDELVASFSKINVKNSGKVTKKIKKTKKVPQATSRPKITKIRPAKKVKKVDDDVSVKKNKYNKRFTKTKKPAKL